MVPITLPFVSPSPKDAFVPSLLEIDLALLEMIFMSSVKLCYLVLCSIEKHGPSFEQS